MKDALRRQVSLIAPLIKGQLGRADKAGELETSVRLETTGNDAMLVVQARYGSRKHQRGSAAGKMGMTPPDIPTPLILPLKTLNFEKEKV